MKKNIFTSALIVFALVSCQKDPAIENAPVLYSVASYDATEIAITGGRSKDVTLYIKSENDVAAPADLTFGLAVADGLVESWNVANSKSAQILPSSAYEFELLSLTVFKTKAKSLSTSVKLKISHALAEGLYVLPVDIESISDRAKAATSSNSTIFIVVNKLASTKGRGTKNDPYLISSASDLMDMHELCRPEEEVAAECDGDGAVYFKMTEDVDLGMSEGGDNDWEPINSSSPYDRKVYFDGNGKTIKNLVSQYYNYPSFLGVVYGTVTDVTFEKPVIIGESALGTLGGYGGTSSSGGRTAVINKVHVKEGKLIQNESENKGVGGIVGRMYGSKIEACSFDGYIESNYNQVGGIIGQDTNLPCEIKDCITSGRINIVHGQRAGGICGCLTVAGSAIRNCISTMLVEGRLAAGGICGHANLDSSSEKNPNNVFEKCIAWNEGITSMSTELTQYSSGTVVGFCAATNYCSSCIRRPGLKVEYKSDEITSYFSPVDQPTSSPECPQTTGIEYITSGSSSSKRYKLPYHGKEAAIGQTASQVAESLNWDKTVWDLNDSIPVLK